MMRMTVASPSRFTSLWFAAFHQAILRLSIDRIGLDR